MQSWQPITPMQPWRPITKTIVGVADHTFYDGTRSVVLRLSDGVPMRVDQKGLARLVDQYGRDTADWLGKDVTVYPGIVAILPLPADTAPTVAPDIPADPHHVLGEDPAQVYVCSDEDNWWHQAPSVILEPQSDDCGIEVRAVDRGTLAAEIYTPGGKYRLTVTEGEPTLEAITPATDEE